MTATVELPARPFAAAWLNVVPDLSGILMPVRVAA